MLTMSTKKVMNHLNKWVYLSSISYPVVLQAKKSIDCRRMKLKQTGIFLFRYFGIHSSLKCNSKAIKLCEILQDCRKKERQKSSFYNTQERFLSLNGFYCLQKPFHSFQDDQWTVRSSYCLTTHCAEELAGHMRFERGLKPWACKHERANDPK